jgi:serine protease AprX
MKYFISITVFSLLLSTGLAQQLAPLGKFLRSTYSQIPPNEKFPVWVYFKDKGESATQKLSLAPQTFLSERAILRRERIRAGNAAGIITMEDIPLEHAYVAGVAGIVTKVRHEVKWFNAMSATVTKNEIERLQALPYVKEIELVVRFKPQRLYQEETILDQAPPPARSTVTPLVNYGSSLNQNEQLNTIALHNQGITGAGILVAIFDAGFANLTHPALVTRPIIARYDFQTNSTTLASHSHGQNTFSCVGGFSDGNLVGTAYGANFALARTEVDPTETPHEEDNWARAAIWADSLGVDVISCSLGYGGPVTPYDPPWPAWTWQDMNGVNTPITRAANRATDLGIVVVNSAGNDGDVALPQNTLGAPADGFDVITAGAVGSTGTRVSFSSVGPTADGRIKPDVMAKGSGTWAASGATGYAAVSGTSFSCPLTAGVAALILQANSGLTPKQVAEALRQTASRATTPDRQYGWGIANAAKAAHYVWMEHTPPGNTADTAARLITLRIRSRIPLIADSARIWYGPNGTITGSALLTPQSPPGTYRGQIPYLGNGVNVTYFFRARNDSNAVRYPLGTAFFAYQVATDVQGPTISHTQRGNIAGTSWPPRLTAKVLDISNPITVSIEYSRNGTAQVPITVTSPDSIYSDTLRIAANQLRDNDSISYRFKAVDARGNISYAPSTDFYGFRVKNFTHIGNNFEANNGSFTGTNDWQYGTPSGISPTAFSGTNVWATVLAGNYATGPRLSSLTTPTFSVFSNRPTFSFYQWYEYESRFDGGNVKASVNGGAFQTIQPVGGYPISAIYAGFANPLAGQPGWSGVEGSRWSKVTFDLTGIAAEGNTIALRFDFGADNNTLVYRGWYVDDFVSDGFGTTGGPLGVGDNGDTPKEFSLQQNYPNPFNPSTAISYQLATTSRVTLKVFDVLGREVATLVNGAKPAGAYEVSWDARNVSSGLYFYRLEAGAFVDMKKMLLLK